ncbi:MAG: EAL domain-containing protein [Ectothiorhodospira sp.]
MQVFIVDDDPFVLRLLTHQLGELGYTRVRAFEQPHELLLALDDARDDWPELVLLDLQMPEMDGVELVRNLACIGFTGAVALVSGTEERILRTARNVAAARGLNILPPLKKPVHLEQLREVLAAMRAVEGDGEEGDRLTHQAEALWQAVYEDELVLHFQPKVRMDTGELVGVEALVRWDHPCYGLLMPDQFLDLMEAHGLMDELTMRVLRGALATCRAWLELGLDLHMAVNISATNLHVLGLPDVVQHTAREAGVPINCLCLELTERMLARDRLLSLDILTRLRLKGASLSIDDFGTGHSSLAQLLQAPFDELKLDRGFVHGATRDPARRAIAEASLRMARKLGMHTTAEGVESTEDWNLMRDLGCDRAQGYFIAPAMPAEAFPSWLEEWNGRREGLIRPRPEPV